MVRIWKYYVNILNLEFRLLGNELDSCLDPYNKTFRKKHWANLQEYKNQVETGNDQEKATATLLFIRVYRQAMEEKALGK